MRQPNVENDPRVVAFDGIYVEIVEEVLKLMPDDLTGLARHNRGWRTGAFDFRKYLVDSRERYRRVLRLLVRANAKRVLDVGGYLAAFPLALKRLGFEVATAERFDYYDHALDGFAARLTAAGVSVLNLDFTESIDHASIPGPFDAITCMAVAEHLAHSPRVLLENIAHWLHPQGTLAFEVPNLAYWPNRLDFFLSGRSMLAPIADVYHSAIPFTGHHREYTIEDARYVVQEAGFRIISEQTFNYALDTSRWLNRLKYAPALLFKEWAGLILLECRSSD